MNPKAPNPEREQSQSDYEGITGKLKMLKAWKVHPDTAGCIP